MCQSTMFSSPRLSSDGLQAKFAGASGLITTTLATDYFDRCRTDVVTGDAQTLSVDNIMDGKLIRSLAAEFGSIQDTTPTAAQIVAEMKTRSAIVTNTGFELLLYFAPVLSNQIYGLVGGTGVSIYGQNSIRNNKAQVCVVIATNVGTGTEGVSFILAQGQS